MLRQRVCLLTDRCEPARSPAAQSPDYLLRKIWTVPIHPPLRALLAPLALLVLLLAPILALLDPLHAPNNSAQSLRRRLARAPNKYRPAVALEVTSVHAARARWGLERAPLPLLLCALNIFARLIFIFGDDSGQRAGRGNEQDAGAAFRLPIDLYYSSLIGVPCRARPTDLWDHPPLVPAPHPRVDLYLAWESCAPRRR